MQAPRLSLVLSLPPAAHFFHGSTSKQLVGFAKLFLRLMALTYRLPDLILFGFRRDLELNVQCQIWNMQYLGPKLPDCHEIKTSISIERYASNVAIEFDVGHDLDIEFSR